MITYSHILTAAHCLVDLKTRKKLTNVDDLIVILGSNDPIKTCDGIERKISSFSFHPEFADEEAYYDVAIATLDKKVPKSDLILRPVCIPSKARQDPG